MRKILYLHVGQPKTGTTSIQQYFYRRDDALRAQGVQYLLWGRSTLKINHKYLWLAFLERLGGNYRKSVKVHVPPPPPFEKVLDEIQQEIFESDNNKFIISFEGFSAAPLYPDLATNVLEEFYTALAKICDIRVICYFREPLEMLKSNYNQRCKASPFTPPFLDFTMRAAPSLLNQKLVFDLYAAVFGADAMICKSFDQEINHGLVVGFIESLDIAPIDVDPIAVNRSEDISNLEEARIQRNLEGVPDTHKERFIYGFKAPTSQEWTGFLERLETANADNAALFGDLFGSCPGPIELKDLIWLEREYNHALPTAWFVKAM